MIFFLNAQDAQGDLVANLEDLFRVFTRLSLNSECEWGLLIARDIWLGKAPKLVSLVFAFPSWPTGRSPG